MHPLYPPCAAGIFRSRANVEKYPFDHQHLNILIKAKRVLAPDGETDAKVVLFNPMRFQRLGHRIEANADWLAEWDMVCIRGANLREVDRRCVLFRRGGGGGRGGGGSGGCGLAVGCSFCVCRHPPTVLAVGLF
jgi:hypothetical protein